MGEVIAHFDDDDLYARGYLSWMWARLLKAPGMNHLLAFSSEDFHGAQPSAFVEETPLGEPC